MEPYQAKKLPLEYKIDKELLRLLAEANEKYGEYKSLLNTLEFDSKYFLDFVLLNSVRGAEKLQDMYEQRRIGSVHVGLEWKGLHLFHQYQNGSTIWNQHWHAMFSSHVNLEFFRE